MNTILRNTKLFMIMLKVTVKQFSLMQQIQDKEGNDGDSGKRQQVQLDLNGEKLYNQKSSFVLLLSEFI